MKKFCCPVCGKRRFELVIYQRAEVKFSANGDHDVSDGPYGDLEWDDASRASCCACGWAGTVKDVEEGRK